MLISINHPSTCLNLTKGGNQDNSKDLALCGTNFCQILSSFWTKKSRSNLVRILAQSENNSLEKMLCSRHRILPNPHCCWGFFSNILSPTFLPMSTNERPWTPDDHYYDHLNWVKKSGTEEIPKCKCSHFRVWYIKILEVRTWVIALRHMLKHMLNPMVDTFSALATEICI